MQVIIKNEEDLNKFIDENGDYNPELTFLSLVENDNIIESGCYVIYGCTYASEAFRFVNATTSLVISDLDYSTEIENQTNDTPFSLKTAAKIMEKECDEYLNVIKNRCNENVWDEDFAKREFIAQCFDDIQNDAMRQIHGHDYSNDCDDYLETCEIREDYITEAFEYVTEKKKEVTPENWDK